jgi:hypothetical protein
LWYSYTTGGLSETLSVDTCNGNTGYDSALEVFDACGGASVTCNDDFCGLQSTINWAGTANTTYFIRVGGFNGNAGTGELTLTATPNAPTTIGQDDCANAALDTISGDGTWLVDNGGATTGPDGQAEANCYKFSTTEIQSDVWVLWNPSVNGTVTMDTCAAGGTNTDTKMAAYPGPACPADGTSLDCNDDTCGLRSTINFAVCCGESYLIQLGSFPGSADGTFNLTATQSGTPCNSGGQRWTQSVDNSTIIPGTVSCNAGGLHTDNSFMRRYAATDVGLGAGSGFVVTAVDWGVESATALGGSGSQPATVNVHSIPIGSPLLFANLNLLESVPVVVADGSLYFINTPLVGASVPAGSDCVLEIFTPDGQGAGNSLFIASNPLGQSAPSYIAAASCGLPEPGDLAAIGFPLIHLIIDPTVSSGPAGIGCNYCGPAVPNSAGLSGVMSAAGSTVAADNNVTLTASDLPANVFGYFLAGPGNGTFAPMSSCGIFCLKGGDPTLLGRYFGDVFNTGAGGTGSLTIDLTAVPTAGNGPVGPYSIALQAGDTWNFQCWYRDAMGCSAANNFTDAISISFN